MESLNRSEMAVKGSKSGSSAINCDNKMAFAYRRFFYQAICCIVTANHSEQEISAHMKRIAIVEDEAAIRENYKDVLQNQGYNVQGYANRAEAMLAFNTRLPDLAIIDIGLEHEIDGGFTLCQALRAMSGTLPIIFLTARDSDFDTVCGCDSEPMTTSAKM